LLLLDELSQFRGVQAKTGREYVLPINETMWELINTAPNDQILDFTGSTADGGAP
jgi:hypothetical protein